MPKYEVGIGRVRIDETLEVDVVYACWYGYVPTKVYAQYNEMRCLPSVEIRNSALEAAKWYLDRMDLLDDIDHIYEKDSDGWALWVKDNDAEDGWKLDRCWDRIAQQERDAHDPALIYDLTHFTDEDGYTY